MRMGSESRSVLTCCFFVPCLYVVVVVVVVVAFVVFGKWWLLCCKWLTMARLVSVALDLLKWVVVGLFLCLLVS
jgi:hypothetical protein